MHDKPGLKAVDVIKFNAEQKQLFDDIVCQLIFSFFFQSFGGQLRKYC